NGHSIIGHAGTPSQWLPSDNARKILQRTTFCVESEHLKTTFQWSDSLNWFIEMVLNMFNDAMKEHLEAKIHTNIMRRHFKGETNKIIDITNQTLRITLQQFKDYVISMYTNLSLNGVLDNWKQGVVDLNSPPAGVPCQSWTDMLMHLNDAFTYEGAHEYLKKHACDTRKSLERFSLGSAQFRKSRYTFPLAFASLKEFFAEIQKKHDGVQGKLCMHILRIANEMTCQQLVNKAFTVIPPLFEGTFNSKTPGAPPPIPGMACGRFFFEGVSTDEQWNNFVTLCSKSKGIVLLNSQVREHQKILYLPAALGAPKTAEILNQAKAEMPAKLAHVFLVSLVRFA